MPEVGSSGSGSSFTMPQQTEAGQAAYGVTDSGQQVNEGSAKKTSEQDQKKVGHVSDQDTVESLDGQLKQTSTRIIELHNRMAELTGDSQVDTKDPKLASPETGATASGMGKFLTGLPMVEMAGLMAEIERLTRQGVNLATALSIKFQMAARELAMQAYDEGMKAAEAAYNKGMMESYQQMAQGFASIASGASTGITMGVQKARASSAVETEHAKMDESFRAQHGENPSQQDLMKHQKSKAETEQSIRSEYAQTGNTVADMNRSFTSGAGSIVSGLIGIKKAEYEREQLEMQTKQQNSQGAMDAMMQAAQASQKDRDDLQNSFAQILEFYKQMSDAIARAIIPG